MRALSRPGRLALVCALALGAMSGLAACTPKADPPSKSTSEAPASTTSEAPAPAKSEAPAPVEKPWTRFTSPRMPYSFEIPDGWSVVDDTTDYYASMGMFAFSIDDAKGETRLSIFDALEGLGGGCSDGAEMLAPQELDSAPITAAGYVAPAATPYFTPTPLRFVYRVSELQGRAIGSLSIANSAASSGSCLYYNVLTLDAPARSFVFADALQVDSFQPSEGRQFRTFASVSEAKAFMNTDEYKTLKRILSSLQF